MFGVFFMLQEGNMKKIQDCFSWKSQWIVEEEKRISMEAVMAYYAYLSQKRKRNLMTVAAVSKDDKVRFFDLKSISCITSKGRVMKIHSKEENFEFYGCLKHIEKQLKELGFIRVNRRCIASLEHLAEEEKGYVKLKDGTRIKTGKNYEKKAILRLN